MKASIREALWFHVLFFVIAIPLLLLMHGTGYGKALLALTLAYNIALPLLALARGHSEWLSLWVFILPLSCGQVLPDWALATVAHAVTFPDHGIWRIGGTVPVYFMGLWIMLLFPIVLVTGTTRSPYINTFALALPIFACAELIAQPLHLWHARNVPMFFGVAPYILIPEALLTTQTLWMYRITRGENIVARLFAAFSVNLFYAGAAFVAFLLQAALY